MKRRHIRPNTRTFATLFVGLSRIDDWSPYRSILQRAYTAYDQLQAHYEKLRLENPRSSDIIPWPINGFLTLLGKAHHYQKMWDVFFSMEGPLRPDEVTYHIMLKAIHQRSDLSNKMTDHETEESPVDLKKWESQFDSDTVPDDWLYRPGKYDKDLAESVHYKNAGDARLVWEHLIRAAEDPKDPVNVNGFHVAVMLHILARGRPNDHHFAFELVKTYLHLEVPARDGQLKISEQKPTRRLRAPVPINPPVLASVLDLCLRTARIETAIYYFQKIAEDPNTKEVLDLMHMLHVLRAFSMRRGPGKSLPDAREAISALDWMIRESKQRPNARLKPTHDHFIFSLTSTWRAADLPSALHIFELITGYRSEDFMDGSSKVRPADPHLQVGDVSWNVACMALLVKTAAATNRQHDMRVVLRILGYLGPNRFFFRQTSAGPLREDQLNAQKELATRMLRGAEILLSEEATSEVEEQRWIAIRDVARRQLDRLFMIDRSKEEEHARQLEAAQTDQEGQRLVNVAGRKSAWNNER